MKSRTLMVLGSMSSVGKSMLVTGLCRLFARRGWKVAPFKAQNMSNNAAVCAGGEIGRAQAVQAFAAGIEPHVDMNPVLLKPEADSRSQVILRGQVWQTLRAQEYYLSMDRVWEEVKESFGRLREQYELVILEGAGSPAELNLRARDLANLRMAHYAQAPCLLVGDINLGGVFAQLLGTLALLEGKDRDLIRALVVNKFRGDADLFSEGVHILEQCSGLPVLGVVPYIKDHFIADEDAASLNQSPPGDNSKFDIAVIHLPHISNFDDFDPLRFETEVNLRYVNNVEMLGSPNMVILPGSKNTIGDLIWLRDSGFDRSIQRLADIGVPIVGICGGYQMLGKIVQDDQELESNLASVQGLGLLPIETQLYPRKMVSRSNARVICQKGFFNKLHGQVLRGYEIHLGRSKAEQPLFKIIQQEDQNVNAFDGACSEDGNIWGCHLHGLFENDSFRNAWLESLGVTPMYRSYRETREQAYDQLADVLEFVFDMKILDRIVKEGV